MPKTIINEIDNTVLKPSEYANFSVVIPGLIKKRSEFGPEQASTTEPIVTQDEVDEAQKAFNKYCEALVSVYDDNGVYETNSQTNFKSIVGIIEDSADAEETSRGNGTFATVKDAEVTEENFDTKKTSGKLYIQATTEATSITYVDQMQDADGKIHDLTAVAIDATYDKDKTYVFIETQGIEASTIKLVRYGNKMAYELLGLGYTVLYKILNVPEYDETTKNWKDGRDTVNTTGTGTTNIKKEDVAEFWECLKDKSAYDFRYITTGGLMSTDAYDCITDVAKYRTNEDKIGQINKTLPGRGDCIALIDVIEDSYITTNKDSQSALISQIIKQVNSYNLSEAQVLESGKYTSISSPMVEYNFGTAREKLALGHEHSSDLFPQSFHYLLCAASAFDNYSEWYAVAGMTRGKSPWKIKKATLKFGDIAVDNLSPRTYSFTEEEQASGKVETIKHAVNVMINLRKEYYIWGNRTAYKLDEVDLKASHFLNIRQLCCTLKKAIQLACDKLRYNPNADALWVDFVNLIRPTLEKMKADQGIKDYKLIRTANTKKALVTAKVRIVPIEAVEDFYVGLYLENDISGIVAGIEEDMI